MLTLSRFGVSLLIVASFLVAGAEPSLGEQKGLGAPEPSQGAVIADLPFAPSIEPGRVLVDLAPEGRKPFVMMLDTGANASVVTPRMARSLGVSVRRLKRTPYRRPTRLGRDLQFYIDTRSSDTGSKTGSEYGLLGSDFLDDYVLEVDFPGRRVRFLDPKKYQVPESVGADDERVIAVKIGGTRIAPDVEIGDRSVRVLLDTGAPDGLVLSGRAARKLDIDVAVLPDLTEFDTAMGKMQVRLYETDRFRFAGFAFDLMPVMVAPRGWYNQAGPNDSVLGVDVLRQFVIRIDYERRRLWLKRSGDTRITHLETDYQLTRKSGAFLGMVGGDFVVIGVLPGSPAQRIGLRPGDALVEAQGEAPLDLAEVMQRIQKGDEITVARQENDVWVDRILPDYGELPDVAAEGGEQSE